MKVMKPRTVSLAENGEASATQLMADDEEGDHTSFHNEPEEDAAGDGIINQPLVGKEQSIMEKGQNGVTAAIREEDQMTELPMIESVFSLLYTAPTCSSAFVISLCIAIAQTAMPLLALVDLVDFTDVSNPLQVPNNVSPQVRIMGAVGLVLAVSQFWDFMEAVRKLQKGPPADISDLPSGVACWKFYFAFILQLLMGLLFLITIFTLVVQSTDVVGMFLNFAALEFIVNVDDLAFHIGKKGYMTKSMKQACDEVCSTTIYWRKGGGCMRRVLMFLTMSVMLGTYLYIRVLQLGGRFDCSSIDVQFGDGFITILPVFSGRYAYVRDYYDGRPIYIDERERAIFRYCRDNAESEILSVSAGGFWAFGIMDKYDRENVESVCKRYISRSPDTKGYSLLEHPANAWLTKRKPTDSIAFAVDYMSIRCADCSGKTCNGKCVNGQCVCLQEQFGKFCQFDSQPCETAHLDLRTTPFEGTETYHSIRHEILRNSKSSPVTLYDRPVYAYFWDDGDADANLLIYLGRRYVLLLVEFALSPESLLEGSNNTVDKTGFADKLERFHPFYDWLEPQYLNVTIDSKEQDDDAYEPLPFASTTFELPEFISDPIDFGTASDVNSPMGLSWKRTATSSKTFRKNPGEKIFDLLKLGAPVDTTLLCGNCSVDNECFNGGSCTADGSCSCMFGNVGMLCEINCYDNNWNVYCPWCFLVPDEPFCDACYSNRTADDCPLCVNDPDAEDCPVSCLSDYTAGGCGSWELFQSNFTQSPTNNTNARF